MRLLVSVLLGVVVLATYGCASTSAGAVVCAADTESAHWSATAQVLIAKTRYGCNQAPVSIQVEVRIDRKSGAGWTEWHTESHRLLVIKPNTTYTVYTSTSACVPGTYRSGGRLVEINSQPGLRVVDYAAKPLFVSCGH